MSKKGLELFSKFIVENKECQAKVKGFGSDFEAIAEYARELGYEVSSAELKEFQEQAQQIVKSKVQKMQESYDSISAGANEFLKLVELAESDEDVAGRLAELGSGTAEDIIAYGREKGFIFNESDMKNVSNNILEPKNELSEEELEQVAGGFVLGGLAIAAILGSVVAGGALGVGIIGGAVLVVKALEGFDE